MTLHPRTLATLDELERADWFAAVGQPLEGDYIVVSSWAAAVRYCSSPSWESLVIEASGAYSTAVAKRSRDRFRQWNRLVEEIKAVSQPLVRRKVGPTVERHSLPQVVENMVQWDVLHVCLEAEYADVFPPGFFASQAYWYVRGRFPCGWEGRFPEGKLVLS